jgi:hypothetical protein
MSQDGCVGLTPQPSRLVADAIVRIRAELTVAFVGGCRAKV